MGQRIRGGNKLVKYGGDYVTFLLYRRILKYPKRYLHLRRPIRRGRFGGKAAGCSRNRAFKASFRKDYVTFSRIPRTKLQGE